MFVIELLDLHLIVWVLIWNSGVLIAHDSSDTELQKKKITLVIYYIRVVLFASR